MEKNTKNVYELAMERLDVIFKNFDNVCVSFSGGKDSGVLLNLCVDYIRKNCPGRKLCVFHMDYEIQYSSTIEYVDRVLESNKDIFEVYRICVPFKVTTCTSMFQRYWRPWDYEMKDIWVRPMPENAYKKENFPFFKENMWDYDFQTDFAPWLHEKERAERTCFLIGIRTQESLNRWRAIYSGHKLETFKDYYWTCKMFDGVYNAYPIYDWKTTDVWTANGKFGYDYNHLYDLYYMAGVPIEKQRVASPFLCEAQDSLKLYRIIDPNTWGKMMGRVNGVSFMGLYGGTHAMGWNSIKIPKGYTWKKYMDFLLSTLPSETAENYRKKLSVSQKFWKERGGCLSDEIIEQLQKKGIPIEIVEKTNYKTDKRAVKMDYLDDIDIADFKEIPTYKRMCICIMKNDHLCKYMGFSLTKEETARRAEALNQFKNLKI